jgi:hypothetical protein
MSSQTESPHLEYDTVSSSTGDFVDNQNQTQMNCNHNESLTVDNQNDNIVSHNYLYQNSFQYHQR